MKNFDLEIDSIDFFHAVFEATADHSRLISTQKYIQHGDTTCLLHSIAVAYFSYRIALRLRPVSFHTREMIRGALLHDYFLYDWHHKNEGHRMHGIHHPGRALHNAEEDFVLSPIEKDIIGKHMFPLTLHPPKYRESVLVCLVDKGCSLYETFRRSAYARRPFHLLYKQNT